MYEVEYKYGHKASLQANAISENMFAQVGGERNRHVLFQDIVNHRYDGTKLKEQDVFITTRTGTKHFRDTTKVVEVLVQQKYGITTWVSLKDVKNSYSVHMAKYVLQRRIAGDPEFAWCIRHVLEKCNRIIGNMKSKYWVQTHKFGANIPKSVQEAKAFDEQNGNSLLWDAICK